MLRRRRRWLTFGVAALVLLAAPARAAAGGAPEIRLHPVVTNLSQPTLVTTARDGSGRLFILEQAGLIKVLQPGASTATVFLDLRAKVMTSDQQGLAGLAFHPRYATNGRFFVDYTRADGVTVVAEYRISSTDANTADPAESIILTIDEPQPNLAAGSLAFGPDGFLYIGAGNAGVRDDPTNTAQDPSKLLGKILRIDVDPPAGGLSYVSPPDNPFAGQTAGRDEIFAYGLRNPWRLAFDRVTGDLYAADVGNRLREEVNLIVRGGNYGWRVREGSICSGNDPALCNGPGFIAPLADYAHSETRCAVIGGHAYRGGRGSFPAGGYVFGDFCSGEIFLLHDGIMRTLLTTPFVISSFGEDEAGELYVVDWLGTVYRMYASGDSDGLSVLAAVLPGARSVSVGTAATAFATMIWTGAEPGIDCGIAPLTPLPGTFAYQTTSAATNELAGTPNTPVSIAPGASQTFVIAFTPSAPGPSLEMLLEFRCANAAAAPIARGVNTLLLAADTHPAADVVAVAATVDNDGIVIVPAYDGAGAFAVATTNLGASALITASVDTAGVDLPITPLICRTEGPLAACVAPPASAVTLEIEHGAQPTFAIFLTSRGTVPFEPTSHRAHVRFTDADGITRGLTSVAVRTD
jgi:glucose/arabinose dehydrogenase